MLKTIAASDGADDELRQKAGSTATELFGNRSGLEVHDASGQCRIRTGVGQPDDKFTLPGLLAKMQEPTSEEVRGYFALYDEHGHISWRMPTINKAKDAQDES